jgi:hypothetical protein
MKLLEGIHVSIRGIDLSRIVGDVMTAQVITKAAEASFETLRKAIVDGDACLMVCKDREHGCPVIAICAINTFPGHGDSQEFEFVPIAKMFTGNPFVELVTPMEEQIGWAC